MSNNRSAEHTINGYLYQFDKTILKILESESGEIEIEGVEDIDVHEPQGIEAVQCKYHALTEFNPSKIKKPIQLFLKDYAGRIEGENPPVKYHLYAHFKSGQDKWKDDYENDLEVFKKKFLKTGDKESWVDLSLSDEDLSRFKDHLTIDINAKNIDEQRKEIFEALIENIEDCKNEKDAEDYYYNNALKVVSHLSGQSENRKITKTEFLKKANKKVFLFNRWYAYYKGRRNYLDFIRRKLKRSGALSTSKHKYLYIGDHFLKESSEEVSIGTLIRKLVDEYFQIGKAFSSKNKVWTIILDCDEDEFKEAKKDIKKNKVRYYANDSDLDNFDIKRFNEEPIMNTKPNDRLEKASFEVKLIRSEDFENKLEEISNIDVVVFCSDKSTSEVFKAAKKDGDSEKYPFQLFTLPYSGSRFSNLSDIHSIFDEVLTGYDYLRITTVEPNLVQVEVTNPDRFKAKNQDFSIGSYLRITDENGSSIIGMLQSYRIKDQNKDIDNSRVQRVRPTFILDVQPMGFMDGHQFKRGGHQITIPPNEVAVADKKLLNRIYEGKAEVEEGEIDKSFKFGVLANHEDVDVYLDGNRFFNKHVAVVGSTGSGKSCTVAKIIQEGTKRSERQEQNNTPNNSRVLIFDLHGEYSRAFPKAKVLSADNLILPYWLMNGEELTELLLDGSESSRSNQYAQLKRAITLNKQRYNSSKKVSFDTPVYFDLAEVVNYLTNVNRMTSFKHDNRKFLALKEVLEKGVEDAIELGKHQEELWKKLSFIESTGSSKINIPGVSVKISNVGDYNLEQLLSRLNAKMNDIRLDFLLKKGQEYRTGNLSSVLGQFLGQGGLDGENLTNPNVTIVNLSGISFDVLSISVSLMSRLLFNLMYYLKRTIDEKGEIENPLLLVYEEAHNYIPKSKESKYRSVSTAVERIAKEGRKYGISAMIVSQRPSEISETIFSQCNSFVVMRLTNPDDQNYVKRLLPDNINSITDNVASLEQREALILGTSVPMPTMLRVDELERRPASDDIRFLEKWRIDWNNISMDQIIDNMIPDEESQSAKEVKPEAEDEIKQDEEMRVAEEEGRADTKLDKMEGKGDDE